MAEPTSNSTNSLGIPSVDELRSLGRERLMTYFAWFGVNPPDELDEMARTAHQLLVAEAPAIEADWAEYMKQDQWVSFDDVLRELGIDDSERSANDPAA